jgi:hypothetical protein
MLGQYLWNSLGSALHMSRNDLPTLNYLKGETPERIVPLG